MGTFSQRNLVSFPGNYIEDMISKTPLDRVGMPEDIASAAWSLVYSLRYVTGNYSSGNQLQEKDSVTGAPPAAAAQLRRPNQSFLGGSHFTLCREYRFT